MLIDHREPCSSSERPPLLDDIVALLTCFFLHGAVAGRPANHNVDLISPNLSIARWQLLRLVNSLDRSGAHPSPKEMEGKQSPISAVKRIVPFPFAKDKSLPENRRKKTAHAIYEKSEANSVGDGNQRARERKGGRK
ncbi:hypothetical protein Dimus_026026 [Dionaea muscipula]